MSVVETPDTLLDRVADELRDRTSKDQAITSAELSEKLDVGDIEANPKTRELVREVMRERHIPIVAGSCGYWVATTPAEIERYTATLDARIQGIQTRKYELIRAWNTGGDGDA